MSSLYIVMPAYNEEENIERKRQQKQASEAERQRNRNHIARTRTRETAEQGERRR